MKKGYSKKFNRAIYEVFAGDYYVSKDQNIVLTTLLGSCISVCLRDKITGINGINHFMLPSSIKVEEIIFSADARYGINAMELLINSMLKKGAIRKGLEAKIFGGGRVLANGNGDTRINNVAQSNIDFVLAYLSMEEIPILSKDVGANYGRKIFFFPDSFNIYLKRVKYDSTLSHAVNRERDFFQWIQKEQAREGEVTLFD